MVAICDNMSSAKTMRHYAETHDCKVPREYLSKEKSPHTSMIDATFLTTLGSLMSRRLDFGINDSDDSSTNVEVFRQPRKVCWHRPWNA
ncbi:hypothetical protein CEXT_418401 [Caerostris extrusa]|uniref:Uncharacterized protein n=1 Tax=Caerostris extrusa TaxID=172846 RepID=A0AAV4WTY9_CAEEX|nr:hypothetical protein CEXT_418401 [Caerostris extrusa]